MTLDVREVADTVLSASRKRLFRRKPVFEPYAPASLPELQELEKELGTTLPDDLRDWLLELGYGDINDELSFRKEWFARIDSGQLKGGARFAQDILGDFFAFDSNGHIFFLSRSEPAFAEMSSCFIDFIEEIIAREYKLIEWVNNLRTLTYYW